MGEHRIEDSRDPLKLRLFMQRLLDEVRALEHMLENGLLESGVTRLGAEQELFLVDADCRPAPMATELLAKIDDPHFTTELARFNLEINLDPLELTPDCFSRMQEGIETLLGKARRSARELGIDVMMTGILPTLEKGDMGLANMTPMPRYDALNQAIRDARGSDFRFHIKGSDEITLRHDSVMLEACNTSFQVHLQVAPERFAHLYNLAQAAAGPVLAAAVGSPLLFGRRLWHETRIALFQQALDTRKTLSHRRLQHTRVSFGERWLDDSVIEIFREDIARFRLLLSTQLGEDPWQVLERGELPDLKALRMHNGTVYRWNRPCYGVANGTAHLRIENRMLPAGPTPIDEVANAAFWVGLVKGFSATIDDIKPCLPFGSAKRNFQDAARHGLEAQATWIDGRVLPIRKLILDELLLRAHDGLAALGIAAEDRDLYLEVIERRVSSGQTASRWALDSLAEMEGQGTRSEHLVQLTAALRCHQEEGEPVHRWPLVRWRDSAAWRRGYGRISSLMSTDLFTVGEHEVIDLVASLMDWRHIRHVPVEDREHRLVGLMTHRTLMRVLAQNAFKQRRGIPVHEVMQRDLITVSPDTPTLDAIELMRRHRIACLPVVEQGRLAGIVTERDFMKLADPLLEDMLRPHHDAASHDSAEAAVEA